MAWHVPQVNAGALVVAEAWEEATLSPALLTAVTM
jgi:hypothetical protein